MHDAVMHLFSSSCRSTRLSIQNLLLPALFSPATDTAARGLLARCAALPCPLLLEPSSTCPTCAPAPGFSAASSGSEVAATAAAILALPSLGSALRTTANSPLPTQAPPLATLLLNMAALLPSLLYALDAGAAAARSEHLVRLAVAASATSPPTADPPLTPAATVPLAVVPAAGGTSAPPGKRASTGNSVTGAAESSGSGSDARGAGAATSAGAVPSGATTTALRRPLLAALVDSPLLAPFLRSSAHAAAASALHAGTTSTGRTPASGAVPGAGAAGSVDEGEEESERAIESRMERRWAGQLGVEAKESCGLGRIARVLVRYAKVHTEALSRSCLVLPFPLYSLPFLPSLTLPSPTHVRTRFWSLFWLPIEWLASCVCELLGRLVPWQSHCPFNPAFVSFLTALLFLSGSLRFVDSLS